MADTRRLYNYCTRCFPPGAVAGPEAPRSYSSPNLGPDSTAGAAVGGPPQPIRSADFRLAPDGFYFQGKDRRAYFPVRGPRRWLCAVARRPVGLSVRPPRAA